MAITIIPVTPNFAAEVGDVDLTRALSGEDFEVIQQAFWKYAVLIFPQQPLTTDQQLAFSGRWGAVENERTPALEMTRDATRNMFADAVLRASWITDTWHVESTAGIINDWSLRTIFVSIRWCGTCGIFV